MILGIISFLLMIVIFSVLPGNSYIVALAFLIEHWKAVLFIFVVLYVLASIHRHRKLAKMTPREREEYLRAEREQREREEAQSRALREAEAKAEAKAREKIFWEDLEQRREQEYLDDKRADYVNRLESDLYAHEGNSHMNLTERMDLYHAWENGETSNSFTNDWGYAHVRDNGGADDDPSA